MDVGFDEPVIDERREHVHEEDGEHHSLWVGGVDDSDEDDHDADEETIDEFAVVGEGGGDGVGCHEDESEGPSADDDVPVEGDGEHLICFRLNAVEDVGGEEGSDDDAEHGAPGSDLGGDEDDRANDAGEGGGFAHGAGDEAEECVPPFFAEDTHIKEREPCFVGGGFSEPCGAADGVG